jgi:phage terminase large subunit-like protein
VQRNESRRSSTPSPNASKAEWLASLSKPERDSFLNSLSPDELEQLEFDWSFWARSNQLAPDGNWSVWLILAGRGYGKTRSGAEWVRDMMCGTTPLGRGRMRHMALVGQTAADVRDVMVGDGKSPAEASGILQVHPKDFRPVYNSSLKRLTWPNGAIASLFNATEPESLRGPQFDGAWADELAKWQYATETWDMLQFGLRLGEARACVTTTPKPIKLLKDLLKDDFTPGQNQVGGTVVTRGTTYENAGNLSPKFLSKIVKKYEGTRLGRQELNAEVLDDVPGSLWSRDAIEELRVDKHPPLARVVIGVDPSGSDGNEGEERDGGDDIGIIAVGRGIDGHLYVLRDATCDLSPAGWGGIVVKTYNELGGDRVVAESNFGGAMVAHVIRTADPNVPYKGVHASRGKWVRAEPVSALYEQKRVHHVGAFPDLEDEMCSFGADGLSDGKSPNRMDALVWAITELELADGNMIFDTPEQQFLCDPIKLPPHWERAVAIECDHTRFAAVWAAFNREDDVLYITHAYAATNEKLAVNAAAVRRGGSWVPAVFCPAARKRDKAAGQQLVDDLLEANVVLFTVDEGIEAGIDIMRQRFATRSVRVFNTLTDWLQEFRRFRRNEKGELAADVDHLMRATCTLALSGQHVAMTQAVALGTTTPRFDGDGRSEATGY